MERVNKIINNKKYKYYLYKIREIERDRIFCKHDLEHFLNMSRIAYIMILESKIDISKEIIYAIGLLHDIGRYDEYAHGINHNEASLNISKEILKQCDFEEEEIKCILDAIGAHRNESFEVLNNIIYKADKISRNCIECNAKEQCNWDNEKKNLYIRY